MPSREANRSPRRPHTRVPAIVAWRGGILNWAGVCVRACCPLRQVAAPKKAAAKGKGGKKKGQAKKDKKKGMKFEKAKAEKKKKVKRDATNDFVAYAK